MKLDKWKIMLHTLSVGYAISIHGMAYCLFGWLGVGFLLFAFVSFKFAKLGIRWLAEYKYGSISIKVRK